MNNLPNLIFQPSRAPDFLTANEIQDLVVVLVNV